MDPNFAAHKMRFYNYDRKKAGQILESARWRLGDDGIRVKDGRRLSIELIAQSTASRRKVVPFLVKSWKQIGVELKPVLFRSSKQISKRLKRADYSGMILYSWKMELDYPLLTLFHSRSVPSVYNHYEGGNTTRWSNEGIDRATLALNGTHALDDRRKLVSKIAEFYSEDLPALPLYFRSSYAMSSPRVEGFYIAGHQYPSSLYHKNWRLSGVR